MALRYVSSFLSHSWKQKNFVLGLARELTRRGMLAWIDQNELPVGINLDHELRKANEKQLTVTAVITEDSLASSWCNDELKVRIEAAGEDGADAIIPIFVGRPLALVKSSPLLRTRWLSPDGASVRRLFAEVPDTAAEHLPGLARRIAATHYERLGLQKAPRVLIAFDQRGKKRRLGRLDEDIVPSNWLDQDWPTLVFRPDQGERSPFEVCAGDAWTSFRDTVVDALGEALGTRRRREVYIAGNGQLAFAWLAGTIFDRSCGARVSTFNMTRGGQFLSLDMDDPRFQVPLQPMEESEVRWQDDVRPDDTTASVSAYMGPAPFEGAVHQHRKQAADTTPLALRHTDAIGTPDDVIALARWLATVAQGRALTLYTSVPFHAVVLLAGLTKHQIGRVTLMEWQRASSSYTPCVMPEA